MRDRNCISGRGRVWISCALSLLLALPAVAATPRISTASGPQQAGMVDVRELIPDIAVEMRYASDDNFIGQPVPGYDTPRCYLLRPVAEALQRVQRDLQERGYALKIFDCYRPAQSVRHFVEWAADLRDQRNKQGYYPHVDKSALLGEYIAPTSGHSRGATVDLTLMRCHGGKCAPLDMGTGFDFFDSHAHTDAPDIGWKQRTNRQRLVRAMAKGGFANYPAEWWHYTLRPEPDPGTAYDFPIR